MDVDLTTYASDYDPDVLYEVFHDNELFGAIDQFELAAELTARAAQAATEADAALEGVITHVTHVAFLSSIAAAGRRREDAASKSLLALEQLVHESRIVSLNAQRVRSNYLQEYADWSNQFAKDAGLLESSIRMLVDERELGEAKLADIQAEEEDLDSYMQDEAKEMKSKESEALQNEQETAMLLSRIDRMGANSRRLEEEITRLNRAANKATHSMHAARNTAAEKEKQLQSAREAVQAAEESADKMRTKIKETGEPDTKAQLLHIEAKLNDLTASIQSQTASSPREEDQPSLAVETPEKVAQRRSYTAEDSDDGWKPLPEHAKLKASWSALPLDPVETSAQESSSAAAV